MITWHMTDLCRQRVDLLSFLEGHAAENRAEPWFLRRRQRLRFWELRGAPFHHVLRVCVFFALKVAGKAGFEFCFFVFFRFASALPQRETPFPQRCEARDSPGLHGSPERRRSCSRLVSSLSLSVITLVCVCHSLLHTVVWAHVQRNTARPTLNRKKM